MYSPQISKADFKRAKYEKDFNKSVKIRRRMEMIYLKYKNYLHETIADIIGVTPKTISTWLCIYESRGLDGLAQLKYKGQPSILHDFKKTIKEVIEQESPRSIEAIQFLVKEHTGVSRSLTQIRYFVTKHLGIRRRKIQPLPGGNIDLEELASKQEYYLKNTLKPLIHKSLSGKEKLFFCDAVHPVQGFYNSYVYSEKSKSMRTSSGRNRFNLLSALDVTNMDLISIYGGTYVNSDTTVELLELLRKNYPEDTINLVLDNARYQRCQYVQEQAELLKINLFFLPTYSPNLNLIERLWKFLKKTALAGKYFATKESFQNSILDFLTDIENGKYTAKLKTLINYNFQDLTKLAV